MSQSQYVWLTPLSQQFLEQDYLLPGQSVDNRVTDICNIAETILDKPGFARALKENIQKGWYSLSTPIWANFGTDRGLPISCFGSTIDDTMKSILYTQAEVGMMTKYGGGTSATFGKLRPRGSEIKNNGSSSGSVHFMQLFNTITNIISQGATRRGSFAAYLPIDHNDIEEFLTIRNDGHPIQDISFGVTVPDYWMKEMISGDAYKRKVWAKVLESRANKGYPYIVFIDNANKNTADVYIDRNLQITHSNLCVTGDQLVVTDEGIKRVIDLYNSQKDQLILFDGINKVNASKMKLIEKNVPIYKIVTKSGRSHKVTAYHKIKTDIGMIAASKLNVGDKVCIQRNKGLFGKIDCKEKAFLLGLYQADGTQTDKSIFIDIWENDFDLIEEIEQCIEYIYKNNNWNKYMVNVPNRGEFLRSSIIPKFFNQKSSQNGVLKKRLQSSKLKQDGFCKGRVPNWILEGNEKTQCQYLRGLYYADGTVRLGNSLQLSLSNINKEFLQQIQIILSNFGIESKIYLLRKSGKTLLPDGKGEKKLYDTKTCYRLVTSNKKDAIQFEKMTGFLSRKGVNIEDKMYRDNTKKFDEIESITIVENEDVYCTTVDSNEHVWVCNSFITSNCSEILLPDNSEESFVCDLSSMNVHRYDEWKNTNAIELLVYLLDAVMTEFIEKASKVPFMERAVNFAKRHRALGIGWLGWHNYLQNNMIPYESMEAKFANIEIAKNIFNNAYRASEKLAAEYGEPELLKGYGRRNTTLCAIAPTKSSSFIIGQESESIEPHRANVYIKDLAKIKHTIINPYLAKLLTEKGKYTDSILDSILRNGGSVQHLSCLNEHEKNVFKTFQEISPKEVIIQAAQRQKYIDQGQSLNLMIHPSIPIKDVNKLLIEAWELGVKSLYYQFSVNAAQEFSKNILNCTNCEG